MLSETLDDSIKLTKLFHLSANRLITNEFNQLKKPIPPCKSIERLSQTTYETDLGNKCAFFYPYFGKLMLTIDYHKETMYKEIKLVRAYTMENLVGNAGKMK